MCFLMSHCSGTGRWKCHYPATANGSPGSKCSSLLATGPARGQVRAHRQTHGAAWQIPRGWDTAPRPPPQSFLKRIKVNRAPRYEGTESGLVLLSLKSVRKFPFMSMKSGLCFVSAAKKVTIRLLHPFPGRSGHYLALLASTPLF